MGRVSAAGVYSKLIATGQTSQGSDLSRGEGEVMSAG